MRIVQTVLMAVAPALAACSHHRAPEPKVIDARKPALAIVRALEARLAREPCIGSLSRWSRRYRYRYVHDRLNENQIVIDYEEAGHNGRPAGLSIEPIYGIVEMDDSDFQLAFGIYDAGQHVIHYWSCGSNNAHADVPRRDLAM